MIPAPFTYRRADSVEEAISFLDEDEDAKLLAGGHSLLPLMKLRLATPTTLVDIGRIPSLAYVDERDDHVAIGAGTRHHDLATSPVLAARVPMLQRAAGSVGDLQVRHRGTIGGSLVHGDPASDLPAAVLALGGTFVVAGAAGTREVHADDFFQGFLETAIEPDEVLTEIRVPFAFDGAGFEKFTRRAQDWAIVGVAVARRGDEPGVALVNMAPTPLRALAVESALRGGASAAVAAEVADEGTEPTSDLGASSEYRRHLARVLVRRALEQAGW